MRGRREDGDRSRSGARRGPDGGARLITVDMAAKGDKRIDVDALGQAMDATFTRSSASYGPTVNTHSVKATFAGSDKVKVVYTTVVSMVRDRELFDTKRAYEKEADSFLEAAVKKINEQYKESTGSSLKFKRISVDSNIEIVDLNQFNGKRTAYFRRVALFEVV